MKFFANNADYYDALKRIASYQTVEQLRHHGIPCTLWVFKVHAAQGSAER